MSNYKFRRLSYFGRDLRTHLESAYPWLSRMTPLYAYWCRANNFGDWITPVLLRHYGFNPIYTVPAAAEIVAVGSILEQLPMLYGGVIIGTGVMFDDTRLQFPKARILAVRGEVTKRALGLPPTVSMGDPGLLLTDVYDASTIRKTHSVGLVPHCTEMTLSLVCRLSKVAGIRVIDPRQHPGAVFREIASCEAVVSSSLHGLIVADAIGLPTRRVILSAGLIGKDVKFDDYTSALGATERPLADLSGEERKGHFEAATTIKNHEYIARSKEALRAAFATFFRTLPNN